MKASNSQKIRTGLFALVGLFLLVGAVFLIGKTKNMFGKTFHIYGTFKNVGGLQIGNNVRFVGINVGTVQNIQIVSDTLARVDMIIEKDVNKFIKKTAMASIGSDGLMGDKLIVIASADESGAIINDGERIATVDPIDYSKTIDKINKIADNAEVITEALAGITTNISEGKGSLGRLLYNDKLAKNLEGTVANIKEGTQGFSDNMQALKGNVLLRGYYKKKERQAQDSIAKVNNGGKELSRSEKRKLRREEKKEAKENK